LCLLLGTHTLDHGDELGVKFFGVFKFGEFSSSDRGADHFTHVGLIGSVLIGRLALGIDQVRYSILLLDDSDPRVIGLE